MDETNFYINIINSSRAFLLFTGYNRSSTILIVTIDIRGIHSGTLLGGRFGRTEGGGRTLQHFSTVWGFGLAEPLLYPMGVGVCYRAVRCVLAIKRRAEAGFELAVAWYEATRIGGVLGKGRRGLSGTVALLEDGRERTG